MATITGKQKRAVVREWPQKEISEIAQEQGMSKAQVRRVLREKGLLDGPNLKRILAITAALALATAAVFAIYTFVSRPSLDRLARLERPNVLLVTIDTLRADHLGCYGHTQAQTPVIDGLASSGVRFSTVYSPAPLTLPSHSTILTGSYPERHGVRENGLFVLPEQAVTLAEMLQSEGFETGAVVAASVLNRQYGLDQGFKDYNDQFKRADTAATSGYEEITATEVADKSVRWIQRAGSKPWFLWMHFFDPHALYKPPSEFRQRGLAPYDGEIAYVDHELGRVLDALDELGLRKRTLVVVTADHGESLGEHQEKTHGFFLYEGPMRVPLIFSLPGALPKGKVVSNMANLTDVAPSVLSALGSPEIPHAQGRSLVPLMYSQPPDRNVTPVVLETMAPWYQHGWSPSFALVSDNFKYIEAPIPELYDIARDPKEQHNLFQDKHDQAELMAQQLRVMRAENASAGIAETEARELDQGEREALEKLGYLYSDPVQPGPNAGDAPDVKQMTGELRQIDDARTMRSNGRIDEGVAILEGVLKNSPNNRRVLNHLGVWLDAADRPEEAILYLERLVQLDPGFSPAYMNLVMPYIKQGSYDKARKAVEKLVELRPRSAKAWVNYGILEMELNNQKAALEHFATALEIEPQRHEAWANMAVLYGRLGDHKQALDASKRAVAIRPKNSAYRRLVDQHTAALQRQ